MKKTLTAVVAGIVFGFLCARFLFVGSWLSLILWSIVGLAIGSWGTKNEALVNGVTYGFILSFVFMLAGYSGKFSLVSRLPFFAVLAVLGGVCGLGLALLGNWIKARIARRGKVAV